MTVRKLTILAKANHDLQIASLVSNWAAWLTNQRRIDELNELVNRLESGYFNYDSTTSGYQRVIYLRAYSQLIKAGLLWKTSV